MAKLWQTGDQKTLPWHCAQLECPVVDKQCDNEGCCSLVSQKSMASAWALPAGGGVTAVRLPLARWYRQ